MTEEFKLDLDLSEIEEYFERVLDRLHELGGKQTVPIEELLPDDFVAEHTEFDDRAAFADAVGLLSDEWEELADEERDMRVAACSEHETWEELLHAAMQRYMWDQLTPEDNGNDSTEHA